MFNGTLEGQNIHNLYTIEDIKRIMTTFIRANIEAELSLTFCDKKSGYMIIGYLRHISFQRCEITDGSGETVYASLDELFNSELIDGICLTRDWYKVAYRRCQTDMEDMDMVMVCFQTVAAELFLEYFLKRLRCPAFFQRIVCLWLVK